MLIERFASPGLLQSVYMQVKSQLLYLYKLTKAIATVNAPSTVNVFHAGISQCNMLYQCHCKPAHPSDELLLQKLSEIGRSVIGSVRST